MINNFKTVNEIRVILSQINDIKDPLLKEFLGDKRIGVQKLMDCTLKRLRKRKSLVECYYARTVYERLVREKGYYFIAGIDEVGRGALAGPVVAAAVILPFDCQIYDLNDSKLFTRSKRKKLYEIILKEAISIGIGSVDSEEIDRINIYQATKLAMQKAIDAMSIQPDFLLIDAMRLDNGLPQENLIKGDNRSISIAAASIVAKVTRDCEMAKYDEMYPGYNFNQAVGYGTKRHLEALSALGITPIHRKTFAPVKAVIESLKK